MDMHSVRPTTSTVIPNLQFFEDAQRWALAVCRMRRLAEQWRAAAAREPDKNSEIARWRRQEERACRKLVNRSARWVRMYGDEALASAAMRTPVPLRMTYADKLTPEQVAELKSREGGAA